MSGADRIELWSPGWPSSVSGKYKPTKPLSDEVDIEVIEVGKHLGRPQLPMRLSCEDVRYAGDAYFYGFPFGLGAGDASGDVRICFVKKATVGGSYCVEEKWICWLLDGINNPGFSGGPVIHYHHASGVLSVMAIVSGFVHEDVKIHDRGTPIPELTVPMNTGIMRAWDTSYALALIRQVTGE